jgi:nucleoside-diphosphate-sugar epimerase
VQTSQATLVHRIETTAQLEMLLSEPNAQAIETLARLDGDLIVLGASGKMGPTLARMARIASDRAGVKRHIIGVARFSDSGVERQLQVHGIETIRCDLLDHAQLAALPEVANVIAMFGMKFGSTGQEARTWAMNCWLPGMVCQKFKKARIVAFSTGNVYGLVPVVRGGSVETDRLQPAGEYAMSCVGRERIYEHFSRVDAIPTTILRLNYANELRYGVLVDLAQRVWAGQPVDLAMGYFNAIWQGDANAAALSALGVARSPALVVNVAGHALLSVRHVAQQLGRLLDRPVQFTGTENADAILSNAELSHRLFDPPRIGEDQMLRWIADWIQRGGETLEKPTHFEVRDGQF